VNPIKSLTLLIWACRKMWVEKFQNLSQAGGISLPVV
jgi:hypothetical protein